MSKNWSYIRDEWLKSTTIAEDDAKWALEALINTEEDLFEICLLYTSDAADE